MADMETDGAAFGNSGFNAFFGADNGHASLFADGVGNSGGIFQTGIAGTPGVGYEFTLADTLIENNARANLRFGLEFYAADDQTLISESLEAIDLSDQNVNHGGGLVFTTDAIAPVGTVFVRPVILFDSSDSFGDGSENIFVFDASLTPVPEPTSAMAGASRRTRPSGPSLASILNNLLKLTTHRRCPSRHRRSSIAPENLKLMRRRRRVTSSARPGMRRQV